MSLQSILIAIEKLKTELDSYNPIPFDRLQKINYKLRLDWNYHSNKIEGGTLTFEETRSVMMEQLEIHGKPLRDVMEMRGHDEVIKNIQKMGRGEVKITENRIKEIHKTIIFEEEDRPGLFKNRNNYIYNYAGERYDFTPSEDTIDAMNSLSNWLDNQLQAFKKGKHQKSIPEIAFEYHLRFLTIHPFLDGNGRTGRILMNLILIANGFPPVIIRTEEKDFYNKHLSHAQQYEENPIPLYEMLGKLLIRSYETCVKGAKGESLFELEDWEKRLQFIENQTLRNSNDLLKSNETVYSTLTNSVLPLIEYAEIKFSAFDKFYSHYSKLIMFNNDSILNSSNDLKSLIEELKSENQLVNFEKMTMSFSWSTFKNTDKKIEDLNIQLHFSFQLDGYSIKKMPSNNPFIVKKYGATLQQAEIIHFINTIGNAISIEIENKIR